MAPNRSPKPQNPLNPKPRNLKPYTSFLVFLISAWFFLLGSALILGSLSTLTPKPYEGPATYEGHPPGWKFPQPSWSAFREALLGLGFREVWG